MDSYISTIAYYALQVFLVCLFIGLAAICVTGAGALVLYFVNHGIAEIIDLLIIKEYKEDIKKIPVTPISDNDEIIRYGSQL